MTRTTADFDMGSEAGFFAGRTVNAPYVHGKVTAKDGSAIRITRYHGDGSAIKGFPIVHNRVQAKDAVNH